MANTIHVISGSTASGKTAHALAWAQANNAEILSCDALLFYKGMDIGTAKPSVEERALIPHHGIDLVPCSEMYDIDHYVGYAREVVREIHNRGKAVLVCGGSGFYLKSFFAPVVDGISIPSEVRTEVEALYHSGGLTALLRALEPYNPEGFSGLDVHNPIRVMRALERCRVTGKSIASLREAFEAMPSAFEGYTIRAVVLDREDEELRTRIKHRTLAMLEAGLVDEVQALVEAGLRDNPSASRAIGYAQTLEWLEQGSDDLGALEQSISQATWQLVRKQRSWFRNQLPTLRRVMLNEDDAVCLF